MIENRRENNDLVDGLGRRITYLRVSLTEHCNFRCWYCSRKELEKENDHSLMTDDELVTLVEAFTRMGVDKVRFTGGEPLLRPTLVDIVRRVSQIEGITLVGLTTNGYFLARQLPALIDAGLRRLNISIDSLNPETFNGITGSDGLAQVLAAVELAEQSGVFPWVKVNTVLLRGVNDGEAVDFAMWALERRIDLRFIEFMPTLSSGWSRDRFISESEIRERLQLELKPDIANDTHGPARRHKVDGYPGRISFISPISNCFCYSCNRLRITSSGDMVGCLFRANKMRLLPLLSTASNIDQVVDAIQRAVSQMEFRQVPGEKGHDFRPMMKAVGG